MNFSMLQFSPRKLNLGDANNDVSTVPFMSTTLSANLEYRRFALVAMSVESHEA